MTPAEWDSRYADTDQVWSGNPNSSLVQEISPLSPGTVLDVGCGEGADAVWLAQRGWAVTALDVSIVGIERGRRAAEAPGVGIEWVHAGLLDAPLEARRFDLVSALYPALPKTDDAAARRRLCELVAPGGTLLFVHHDVNAEQARAHGFDPALYVLPADVRAALGAGWRVLTEERRARTVTAGAGAGHTHDVVLRALRV